MADPTKFTPGYDYSGFEASQPNKPKPGARLDTDFANIATSVDEIVEAVKDVRRSDGALKNGIVTYESLDVSAIEALGPNGALVADAVEQVQNQAETVDAQAGQVALQSAQVAADREATEVHSEAAGASALAALQAETAAEAARDLAETYAGVDHRAATWSALAAISGVSGDVGYVGTDDTGTHTDPVAGGTVANEGVYRWAANGLGSAQALRIGSTGLAGVRPAITALQGQTRDDGSAFAFAVRDANGDAGLTLTYGGELRVPTLRADGLIVASFPVQDDNPPGWALAVRNENGDIAGGFLPTGTFRAHTANFNALQVRGLPILPVDTTNTGNFAFEVEHFISYGQSLSLGATSTPAISTAQRFNNLMFAGGVMTSHPDLASGYYSALVPHVETNPANHIDGYNAGETPLAGAAEMVRERIEAMQLLRFTDHNYQALSSAPGEGGQSLAQLSPGTTYFTQLQQNITNGYALAQAAGKTYGCRSVFWTQGEEDNSLGTSVATYKTNLTALLAAIDSHVKATNGQSQNVQLIFYQLQRVLGFGPLVQQAFAELSLENANMHLATPMYMASYNDAVHVNSYWSKVLGAYYGLCHHRVVIMGEDWQPVRPVSATRQGAIAEVTFNVPMGRLTLDTTLVPAATNAGFQLFAADGVTPITINSVTVSQYNKVKIVAATTIPANAKLRYAWENGDSVCGPTGHRGNLRDTQGDWIVFGGLNHPMHNWCIHFNNFNIA